jgi:regulatory protein YycH of two-component signal transduction system YycFG
MVIGKIYKVANLSKNKRNNHLTSYIPSSTDPHGWLWTSSYVPYRDHTGFTDGAVFVCIAKVKSGETSYGEIIDWYEVLGPDGKLHKMTTAMRSQYFRSP